METFEAILARRSVRKYQDRPVPQELLVSLLKAAMAAPSAVNKQPWEFIVVDEPAVLSDLQAVLPYGKYPAPAAIVVLARPDWAHANPDGAYWEQDCAAATENILVAAVSLGLGSVWTAVHPNRSIIEDVRRVLGVPDSAVPFNVILVGYPAEAKPPRSQYEERRVHWQRY